MKVHEMCTYLVVDDIAVGRSSTLAPILRQRFGPVAISMLETNFEEQMEHMKDPDPEIAHMKDADFEMGELLPTWSTTGCFVTNECHVVFFVEGMSARQIQITWIVGHLAL